MQKSLERRRERESRHGGDGGTEKKEDLVPDHRTGHTETRFHENTGGTALPMGNAPQLDRGWVLRSFSWEATGAGMLFSWRRN